jgi:oligopeptide transport system substrate-binding protein
MSPRLRLPRHLLTPVVGLLGILAASLAPAQTLHLASAGEPQTLDPHRYNLRLEETLLNDLFLGLTTFDARGQTVPGAAESWSVSDDGLLWTFRLRPDLKWSDGVALTAEDFVYAFRRLQNPATAASLAYFMYMLENAPAINSGQLPVEQLGVRAVDAYTLELRLSRPYPYLLERLLYPSAYPVPRHVIEVHGENWVKPENWVSNGAYVLQDWQPQAFVSMRRNRHFHEAAAIAEVRYHPVVSEQSAYNRYRNGELHAIGSFPIGEMDNAHQSFAQALQISDLLSMMYLVFNTEKAPFDDVNVRQALSLAIDQAILTDKVLRSGAKPAYSFVPALIENYTPVELPHRSQPSQQRLERARDLLQTAGFDRNNPLELTLKHVNGVENKKVNLAITGMWKQIGVRAVLQQAELRNHFAELRQGDFDVAWAGWIGENNPEHYLTLLQSDIGNVNYGRFKSPAYDRILDDAQRIASLYERNQRLHEAEAGVVREYAVVPLYTSAVRRLVSPGLLGWYPNLRDVHQVRYLRFKH